MKKIIVKIKNAILDFLINFIEKIDQKLSRIERWFAYRTYEKYHILNLNTEPGFSDSSEMLLHANFAVLVHFVEHECAGREFGNKEFHPSDKSGLGVCHLYHYCNLPEEYINGKDINKDWRDAFREIKEIYIWWKFERSARIDPNQELDKFTDEIEKTGRKSWFICNGVFTSGLTEEEKEKYNELVDASCELENKYEEEDQRMLHRLIDVRRFLWT